MKLSTLLGRRFDFSVRFDLRTFKLSGAADRLFVGFLEPFDLLGLLASESTTLPRLF